MIFTLLILFTIVFFIYIILIRKERNIEGYEENCKFLSLKSLPGKEFNYVMDELKKYANKELSLRTNTIVNFTNLVIKNVNVLEIVSMIPNGNCYIQECNNKCVCEKYKSFENSKLFTITDGDIIVRTKPDTKLSLIVKGFIKMEIPFEITLKGATAKVETNNTDKFIIRELEYEKIELIKPAPTSLFAKLFYALPQERLKRGINEEVLNIAISLINPPKIKHIN